MNPQLTVTSTNGNGQQEFGRYPQPIELAAKIISWVFHPIFIPVYVLVFLLKTEPHQFAGLIPAKRVFTIIQFGVMYAFFPVVTALLLKALGFIDSIYMRTQKDRIIPYVICMIYYFWVWYVIKNQNVYPDYLIQFSFAIFISSVLGLLSNAYMKISMHAMAMGVMLTFFLFHAWDGQISSGIYLAAALLITGLVCTARFIVSDHSNKEIYTGLFCGAAAMLIAKYGAGFFS